MQEKGRNPCATSDCVVSAPFVAGDDPTNEYCNGLTSSLTTPTRTTCYATKVSPYAFKLVNYAIIHSAGLYHIHVTSVVNPASTIYSGQYGTGGNIFGIAACGVASGHTAVLGSPSDPSAGGVAVSDPYTATGSTPGWNASSCSDPNTSLSGCNQPTAPDGQCVHIYAVGRMCIFNNLSNGKSLIPLGYVPSAYAGENAAGEAV